MVTFWSIGKHCNINLLCNLVTFYLGQQLVLCCNLCGVWSEHRLTSRGGGGCAGSSNYTGNWACFIDCERARPITKPFSVYMVCLQGGGGGRLVLLSLDQSHASSWRITKQLRSEMIVMLSYFYKYYVYQNCMCVNHKVQLGMDLFC